MTLGAHLLQTGALAEAAGAPPALVAAALLHDAGHLRGDDPSADAAELSGRALPGFDWYRPLLDALLRAG